MSDGGPLLLRELARPATSAERFALPTTTAGRLATAAAALLAGGHPAAAPVLAFTVPGRIEVLGKHTDYAGGRSLTAATEQGFAAIAVPRPDAVLSLTDAVSGERAELPLAPRLPAAPGSWTQYARSVVVRLTAAFGPRLSGLDLAFASDLPAAAGLSSGSALLVTVALALAARNRLAAEPRFAAAIPDAETLAAFLSAVEGGADLPAAIESGGRQDRGRGDGSQDNGSRSGVGTLSGSEDHVAILCSRPDQLGLYRYAPVAFERSIPMPPDRLFVVAASGVVAEKSGGAQAAYNRLALEARRAAELWRAATGRGDPHLGAVFASSPDAAARLDEVLAAAGRLDPADAGLAARARQLFAESEQIVPDAAAALAAGDLRRFGELADRSQRLAEEHLGNQVEETVFLARSAREFGAEAASATGAGFGGSVWAMVPRAAAEAFLAEWQTRYRRHFPAAAGRSAFLMTAAGPAAQRLDGRGARPAASALADPLS
jgi:galactokinase